MPNRYISSARKNRKSNSCRNPRGFSMIAHCKAMGKIPRTGKLNRGKLIKSPKYAKRVGSRRR